jgi:hypothetical protein
MPGYSTMFICIGSVSIGNFMFLQFEHINEYAYQNDSAKGATNNVNCHWYSGHIRGAYYSLDSNARSIQNLQRVLLNV